MVKAMGGRMAKKNIGVAPSKRFPGRVYVQRDDGRVQKVDMKNARDGIIYDTVEMLAASVTEGAEYNFFRDITNKDKIDTNITTSRRLATGEKMTVKYIGVYIPQYTGDTAALYVNILKVLENGFLTMKINKQLVAEGPLWSFPSGFGPAGAVTSQNTATGASAFAISGFVTNGYPATKLQYRLKQEVDVFSEHDIDAKIKFYSRNWLTSGSFTEMPTLSAALTVKVILGGDIWGVE